MRYKRLMPVLLFVLILMILPSVQVRVESVSAVSVRIANPRDNEHFSFLVRDEVFSAVVNASGLIPNFLYDYEYWWEIDSIQVNSGTGNGTTSSSGELILSGDTFSFVVDLRYEYVGEHTVTLIVGFIIAGGFEGSDSHTWFRDEENQNEPLGFLGTWYGETVIGIGVVGIIFLFIRKGKKNEA